MISGTALSQYQGPVATISSGYGTSNLTPVSVTNITNDHFFLKKISVFYPTGTSTPLPTLFYSHGYGGNDTTLQIETLRHFASQGYAVVFVPYKSLGVTNSERYLTLFDGFVKAARDLPTLIDTTRVGFFGHSFGGGATPSISNKTFNQFNWGENGRFIYCSAPWYSFELGNTVLNNFPVDCKMLTVLYDDDDVNDHRIGMDVFNNIAIHDSIKDCLIAYSNTISGYDYEANHNLPSQNTTGPYNALDHYVTFRLLDALADYTFTGNLTAKDVALGNGSNSQINMGGELLPLLSTNIPSPAYPQSKYAFPCDSSINERQVYCQTIGLNDYSTSENDLILFPNPTNGLLIITSINQNFEITIYNQLGEIIYVSKNTTQIDLQSFDDGIYFVKFQLENESFVKRVILAK